jgi:hypothetical protein
MKDWRLIVKARRLDISEEELERIKRTLDTLEESFRPLAERLTMELEPITIFRPKRKDPR